MPDMIRLFSPSDSGQPAVLDIVKAYTAYKDQQADVGLVARATVRQSERYLLAFAALFGDRTIEQCKRTDLKRFLAAHPSYKSPHSKANACGYVVACFRWAEEEELIAKCPYSRPRDLPAREPRAHITPDELRQVLMAAKTHGYPMTARAFRLGLWFLWETGCRTCEMRLLKWEHYDDARGVFQLPESKTSKKTGTKRLIVLNHAAWRLIRWLRRKCTGDGYVFSNSQGKPWDKDLFARRFRRYARLAGVRDTVTAYSCRHGFCVARLEAGCGERQVADLMGHESTKLIRWYGRGVSSNVDYLRDTAERRKDS